MHKIGIIITKVLFSSILNRLEIISNLSNCHTIDFLKKRLIFGISAIISINGEIFIKKYAFPLTENIQKLFVNAYNVLLIFSVNFKFKFKNILHDYVKFRHLLLNHKIKNFVLIDGQERSFGFCLTIDPHQIVMKIQCTNRVFISFMQIILCEKLLLRKLIAIKVTYSLFNT